MTQINGDSAFEFATFGEFLKYLRRRAQLSQTDLAIACGYSTPHISHLEHDKRLPDVATLRALFIPALGLEKEPELSSELLKLAALKRGDGVSSVTPVPTARPARPVAVENVSTAGMLVEQHKPVTLLFINLVDFEDVLFEEDYGDTAVQILAALFVQLTQTISTHGGQVYERTQNTLLALWGALAVHEHDPDRALQSALAIRSVVQGFTTSYALPDGIPPVRIAIHTGVVVQQHSPGPVGYIVSGQPIALVQHFEQAAALGGIVVSADTEQLVRSSFDLTPLSMIQIRGRTEPFALYQLEGVHLRAFTPRIRRIEGVRTRLIAREAELGLLQQAFALATEDSETQFITCIGEAGIGKSRLQYEFAHWLAESEITVNIFQGRATPQITQQPYALFSDIFALRFNILDNDSIDAVRAKFEHGICHLLGTDNLSAAHFIGHLLGFDFSDDQAISAPMDTGSAFRHQALRYLDAVLESLSREAPAILQLEDLHWADEASLKILGHFLKRHPNLRLLIIGTARPELFTRHPNWGEGQKAHQRLDLKPLSKIDSRALVRAMLHRVENMPAELRDLIVERAEGNPYYVEELIKVLVEDHVIEKNNDEWHVALEKLAQIRVPTTLRSVLQARLDSLPPDEKLLLQRASVVGRTFWDTAVEALSQADGVTSSVIDRMLADLRERELILQRESSAFLGAREYVIKHAILHDVIYETLLKRQKSLYHTAAAEWLISASDERNYEYAPEIAEHFQRAGDLARAADYFDRAGARLFDQQDFGAALAAFDNALQLLSHVDAPMLRLKIQIQYAKTSDIVGDREAGNQVLIVALTETREQGDERAQAEVLHLLSRRTSGSEARALAVESLDLARKFVEPDLIIDNLKHLSLLYHHDGDVATANFYAAECRAFVQQHNLPEEKAYAQE